MRTVKVNDRQRGHEQAQEAEIERERARIQKRGRARFPDFEACTKKRGEKAELRKGCRAKNVPSQPLHFWKKYGEMERGNQEKI